MSYTTNITTKWFTKIRDSLPGLEITIRSDGGYDGDYQRLKSVWLIEREGERKDYSEFDDLWKALSPSLADVSVALADPESNFLHMLHCGLECGRPISRQPLWDQWDSVADFRDPVIENGVLTFYVYESRGGFDTFPLRDSIARIRFCISEDSFSFTREHVLDLPKAAHSNELEASTWMMKPLSKRS